jgi:hypothetical protein
MRAKHNHNSHSASHKHIHSLHQQPWLTPKHRSRPRSNAQHLQPCCRWRPCCSSCSHCTQTGHHLACTTPAVHATPQQVTIWHQRHGHLLLPAFSACTEMPTLLQCLCPHQASSRGTSSHGQEAPATPLGTGHCLLLPPANLCHGSGSWAGALPGRWFRLQSSRHAHCDVPTVPSLLLHAVDHGL